MASLTTKRRDSFALFAVTAISIVTLWKRKRKLDERARRVENETLLNLLSGDPSVTDRYYLEKAHTLRLALDAPLQSNFRVAAILLLEDGSMVFGTNDEPSNNLAMAMCAERCAFLKYRSSSKNKRAAVQTIYITTDSDTPTPPGTGCREYMYSHPATSPETRVVMQSKDPTSKLLILTLAELHPFPSIYGGGLTPREQVALGEKVQLQVRMELEQLQVPGISQPMLIRLVKAARSACALDNRDSLHAIRYGAAVAIQIDDSNNNNGGTTIEIRQGSQVKALEYSSTLDAVCQLASQMLSLTCSTSNGTKGRALAVVLVDQYGIPHAPFAHARAFLVEHGFGDCAVILTTIRKEKSPQQDPKIVVQSVPARDLAPFIPEFRV